MKYEYFSARDFIKDTYFQRWVRFPTQDSNKFWLEWIENHPLRNHTIDIAKKVILFLDEQNNEAFSQEQISELSKKAKADQGL